MTDDRAPEGQHRFTQRENAFEEPSFARCANCGVSKTFFDWMTKHRSFRSWAMPPVLGTNGPVTLPCREATHED